ncbi:MAG TPA: PQ-loop repeat-containing protein [Symbiobacteriaceae bacterium]|nr:PQ-loop repeat-containing protein [Symbiobacteriaceae bacterium]
MVFDVLQIIGGLIMSFGYIPQIMQILQTKSAADLNLKTFLLMLLGISLMEIYAINLFVHGAGGAFLVTNTISMAAATIMVGLIVRYGRR